MHYFDYDEAEDCACDLWEKGERDWGVEIFALGG
jgi:hypothetical protein